MRLRRSTRRDRIMLLAVAVLAGLGMLAGAAVSVSANSASACAAGTTVRTTNGPVCGIVDNGVGEWLGIPFAAPPVGDLRWGPPQPRQPWTSTLEATAFGSQCIQSSGQGSEDCLYLNVWRPAAGGANLPVLVHIHGGGFLNGSGAANSGSLLASTGTRWSSG